MLPRRREKGLLIEQLPDETIVYDTTNHKVHCLNPLATRVWQGCDGQTSEAELAAILRQELGVPADETLVHLALGELAAVELIEEPSSFKNRISRREAARQLARFGIAAAAAAFIATVAAPTPAQAGTNNCSGANNKLLCLGNCCLNNSQTCVQCTWTGSFCTCNKSSTNVASCTPSSCT